MRTKVKGYLKKLVIFALMVSMLLTLAACGGLLGKGDKPDMTKQPAPTSVKNSDKESPDTTHTVTATPKQKPVAEESDDMFEIVSGEYYGADEPARVIGDSRPVYDNDRLYSLCIIPLRDGVKFSFESIDPYDKFYSSPEYYVMDEFTASLGEYYRLNTHLDVDEYYCHYVRVVAQDGDKQATYLIVPPDFDDAESRVIVPLDKIPVGLEDSNIRISSVMAALAVCKYGAELGWLDEWGLSDTPITPQQLASSQASYHATIHNLRMQLESGYYSETDNPGGAALYEEAIFPGVNVNHLPESDRVANRGERLFQYEWYDDVTICLSAASFDGKTGYVFVCVTYENENGEFEEMYRVDWEAVEPFNVYNAFRYRLVGVMPAIRVVGMASEMYDYYSERYLGDNVTAELKKFGITTGPGYLAYPGAWFVGDLTLIKAIGEGENTGITTYILLKDDDVTVTYLGAEFYYESSYYDNLYDNQTPEGWTDLGYVQIPDTWTYEDYYGEYMLYGSGEDSDVALWVGWLMSDSIETELDRCSYYEHYTFNDGGSGYVLYDDTGVMWIREDWMSMSIYYGDNESIFTNSEYMIFRIADTLTSGSVG